MYLVYVSGVSYCNIAIYHCQMWYEVDMYVARIPNRGSPPAILLRESYREGGKVKNRTLANLSHWPEHKVAPVQRSDEALTKAARKRTDDHTPAHSFTSLLADLATICANQIQPANDMPAFTKITPPPPPPTRALQTPPPPPPPRH